MKFYLSSFKIGSKQDSLVEMVPKSSKIGYIPNALDFVDEEPRNKSNSSDIKRLRDLDIDVELVDLRDYFGKKEELKNKIDNLGGVWVRGGNAFILRQAMKLSGFDEIIKSIENPDFLYSGYSAGVCVLAPDLKSLQIVDDPSIFPYKEINEVIWEGLNLLDYMILPHYKSDHPESKDIDKEVEYCEKNNIPYKPLRDGEVIILK